MTLKLVSGSTNHTLGSISEADLQMLIGALEEESLDDRDYFIDGPTIELLEQRGASQQLLALLRTAVGTGEGVEVRWERTGE
ncbi:MAG TPA: hypothetical protein VFB92_13090 [Vicinamibacterales bacterium]|nr:hypothetical protein [Vicinamibacterales bacterium]